MKTVSRVELLPCCTLPRDIIAVWKLIKMVFHTISMKGLRRETIAVFMENRQEFVRTWLGLVKIGVIPALINYNLRAEPLFHKIQQVVKCKAVNYGSELSQPVSDILKLLRRSRSSFLTFYTGSLRNSQKYRILSILKRS